MKARHSDRALSDEIVKASAHLELHGSLRLLVKDIAAILTKNFPGWQWMIEPDQKGQVINIFNNHLSTDWGYTIRTTEIHNDPKRRLAYASGREILERFGLEPRGLSSQQHALAALPRDHQGQVIPKHAYDRMTKQQREQHNIGETRLSLEKTIERILADG